MPIEERRNWLKPPKPEQPEKPSFAISMEESKIGPDTSMLKMMKRQTALAIKREIKKGELTLKELVDKFFELEE